MLDVNPDISGLTVIPSDGCVPAGSSIELTLSILPTSVGSFESQLHWRVREGKALSLKVAGTVEAPRVFLDREDLTIGGVFCGASHTLPFTVVNKVWCGFCVFVHHGYTLASYKNYVSSLLT